MAKNVLTHDLWFHDYVLAYTNAATLISEDFRDTEDLGGLFSGFDPATGQYDPSSWAYQSTDAGQDDIELRCAYCGQHLKLDHETLTKAGKDAV